MYKKIKLFNKYFTYYSAVYNIYNIYMINVIIVIYFKNIPRLTIKRKNQKINSKMY